LAPPLIKAVKVAEKISDVKELTVSGAFLVPHVKAVEGTRLTLLRPTALPHVQDDSAKNAASEFPVFRSTTPFAVHMKGAHFVDSRCVEQIPCSVAE
jgi:hypothetical protein